MDGFKENDKNVCQIIDTAGTIKGESDMNDQINQQPQDIAKVIASQKSYVSAAVITFILYWLFWIPGIIFNIMYINDANKTKRLSGQNPSGMGCLYVLLVLGLIPLFIFGSFILAILGSAIGSVATH